LNDVLHKFLAKKTYCRFPNSSFSETKKHQIKNVKSSSTKFDGIVSDKDG
jgi:hypothetical protein